MSKSELPAIGIVSSDAFDFGNGVCDSDSQLPLGLDFAKYVEEKLLAHGASSFSAPVPGEGGWSFDVDINSEKFRVFSHWAPIGNPPVDRWVIQVRSGESFLDSLLRRRRASFNDAIISFLKDALATSEAIEEIQWISHKEFTVLY